MVLKRGLKEIGVVSKMKITDEVYIQRYTQARDHVPHHSATLGQVKLPLSLSAVLFTPKSQTHRFLLSHLLNTDDVTVRSTVLVALLIVSYRFIDLIVSPLRWTPSGATYHCS